MHDRRIWVVSFDKNMRAPYVLIIIYYILIIRSPLSAHENQRRNVEVVTEKKTERNRKTTKTGDLEIE